MTLSDSLQKNDMIVLPSNFLVKGELIKRFKLPANSLLSFYKMDGQYFSILTNSISSKILKQEETTLERMNIISDIYKDNELN